MYNFKLKSITTNRAQITSDETGDDIYYFNKLIEIYSTANPAYKHCKFAKSTRNTITFTGLYQIGLTEDIIKSIKKIYPKSNITIDNNLKKILYPLNITEDKIINPKNNKFKYRDYQYNAIKEYIKKGRGIILLPTSAGKSLVISGIINTVLTNSDIKTILILVPTLQLVKQIYNDFADYGDNISNIQMFSSFNPNFDKNKNIIIANRQWLERHSDQLPKIDMLIVDETHTIAEKNNNVSKYVKSLETSVKLGLTGTLPDGQYEKWSVIGLIGPIIYEEKITTLQEQKYIANIAIHTMKFKHLNKPKFIYSNPLEMQHAYLDECTWIESNENINKKIIDLAENLQGNTLILTDHIEHSEKLYELISKKERHLIKGDVELDYRENVRKLMETKDNIVTIAITKCFSTGINIKNIRNIIFACGGKSLIKIIQSIGRGLRIHENKKKLILVDTYHNLRYSLKHYQTRKKLYKAFYDKYPIETEINI